MGYPTGLLYFLDIHAHEPYLKAGNICFLQTEIVKRMRTFPLYLKRASNG